MQLTMSGRVGRVLQTVGALAGIAALLVTIGIWLPDSYSVVNVYCESDRFVIGGLTTSSGKQVVRDCQELPEAQWKQGFFSRTSTLTATGKILDPSVTQVWVVLVDQ